MKQLKVIQQSSVKVLNWIYGFGVRAKERINFIVKSTLYIYASWLACLFLLSNAEAKIEFAVVWSEASVHLLPLITFAALFWIFFILLPVFPKTMDSKAGKVITFFLIFGLVSYPFMKAIFAVI